MTTPADRADRIIVKKVMDRIFKRDQQLAFGDARLLKPFEGHAHRVMETTVNTVSNFTGLAVNIPDPVARRIVAQGGTHLLSMDIKGQTRKALFRGLAESRAAGYHPSSAATRRLIEKHVTAGRFVNAGPKYRAKPIARTETMYAQNESAMATYEASDAVQQGEIADNQTGFGDADMHRPERLCGVTGRMPQPHSPGTSPGHRQGATRAEGRRGIIVLSHQHQALRRRFVPPPEGLIMPA